MSRIKTGSGVAELIIESQGFCPLKAEDEHYCLNPCPRSVWRHCYLSKGFGRVSHKSTEESCGAMVKAAWLHLNKFDPARFKRLNDISGGGTKDSEEFIRGSKTIVSTENKYVRGSYPYLAFHKCTTNDEVYERFRVLKELLEDKKPVDVTLSVYKPGGGIVDRTYHIVWNKGTFVIKKVSDDDTLADAFCYNTGLETPGMVAEFLASAMNEEDLIPRSERVMEEQSEHRSERVEGSTSSVTELCEHPFFDLSDSSMSNECIKHRLSNIKERLERGEKVEVDIMIKRIEGNGDSKDVKQKFFVKPLNDDKFSIEELNEEKGLSAVLSNSDHAILLLEKLIGTKNKGFTAESSVMPAKAALERLETEHFNKEPRAATKRWEQQERLIEKSKTYYPENQSYPFECPRCRGRGELPRLEDIARGMTMDKITGCPTCVGTGVLWSSS